MTALAERENALFDEWSAGRPSFVRNGGYALEYCHPEARLPENLLCYGQAPALAYRDALGLRALLTRPSRAPRSSKRPRPGPKAPGSSNHVVTSLPKAPGRSKHRSPTSPKLPGASGCPSSPSPSSRELRRTDQRPRDAQRRELCGASRGSSGRPRGELIEWQVEEVVLGAEPLERPGEMGSCRDAQRPARGRSHVFGTTVHAVSEPPFKCVRNTQVAARPSGSGNCNPESRPVDYRVIRLA